MIAYMDTHPEEFEEAILLAVSNKPTFSWRAAWLLWSCMKENDQRIKGYIHDIIETLATKNDDHQRELIKILLLLELDEQVEGFLFNTCVTVWEQIGKKPSVRHTAFKMIVKIAKKHPDLSPEIFFLTQDQYLDSLSSAARKSILKMIKEFTV